MSLPPESRSTSEEARLAVQCRDVDQHILALRFTTQRDQLAGRVSSALAELLGRFGTCGLPPCGTPFLVVHGMHDEQAVLEIGLPVEAAPLHTGRAHRSVIPAGRYLTYERSYRRGVRDVVRASQTITDWLVSHHERALGPLYMQIVDAAAPDGSLLLRMQRKILAGRGAEPTLSLVRDLGLARSAVDSLQTPTPARTRASRLEGMQ